MFKSNSLNAASIVLMAILASSFTGSVDGRKPSLARYQKQSPVGYIDQNNMRQYYSFLDYITGQTDIRPPYLPLPPPINPAYPNPDDDGYDGDDGDVGYDDDEADVSPQPPKPVDVPAYPNIKPPSPQPKKEDKTTIVKPPSPPPKKEDKTTIVKPPGPTPPKKEDKTTIVKPPGPKPPKKAKVPTVIVVVPKGPKKGGDKPSVVPPPSSYQQGLNIPSAPYNQDLNEATKPAVPKPAPLPMPPKPASYSPIPIHRPPTAQPPIAAPIPIPTPPAVPVAPAPYGAKPVLQPPSPAGPIAVPVGKDGGKKPTISDQNDCDESDVISQDDMLRKKNEGCTKKQPNKTKNSTDNDDCKYHEGEDDSYGGEDNDAEEEGKKPKRKTPCEPKLSKTGKCSKTHKNNENKKGGKKSIGGEDTGDKKEQKDKTNKNPLNKFGGKKSDAMSLPGGDSPAAIPIPPPQPPTADQQPKNKSPKSEKNANANAAAHQKEGGPASSTLAIGQSLTYTTVILSALVSLAFY